MMLWILGFAALAQVEVAFFEAPLEFEEGGRFVHLAISYEGGWLHSLPGYGVIQVETLEEINVGTLGEVLTSPRGKLQPHEVASFLGAPYDGEFRWDNEAFYCSELVAKLLGIAPRPMTFDGDYWKQFPDLVKARRGDLGISPDEIYEELTGSGS